MINILLIGLGYHSRRIYYPILLELQAKNKIDKISIVDLEKERCTIKSYLKEKEAKNYKLFLLKEPENEKLSSKTFKILEDASINVSGVIISTEPLAHIVYAKWALKKQLHILMDKPVSTHKGISTDTKKGKQLIADFDSLKRLYLKQKKIKKDLIFAIMAQRRFHKVFMKVRELIREMHKETNCPVTSIQAYHGDGQWRFPTEIIEQNYHPYNQGYGKCSHSGYHFFDMVAWLMRAGEGKGKVPDNFDVFTSCARPPDFVHQFNFDDYRKNFKDFDDVNKYTEKQFINKTKDFGEIDAYNQFSFKKGNKVQTLASINLSHNGFAQRGWCSTLGRDLYKGNGRVRHEQYHISQGPFQAIVFNSYQSKEVNPKIEKNIYKVGGEYHLDVYCFRNTSFNPKWKCVEKYSVKDLITRKMEDKSRGHQEDARRSLVISFINHCDSDKNGIELSDLLDYERSVKMMSGAYQSIASKSLINIKL